MNDTAANRVLTCIDGWCHRDASMDSDDVIQRCHHVVDILEHWLRPFCTDKDIWHLANTINQHSLQPLPHATLRDIIIESRALRHQPLPGINTPVQIEPAGVAMLLVVRGYSNVANQAALMNFVQLLLSLGISNDDIISLCQLSDRHIINRDGEPIGMLATKQQFLFYQTVLQTIINYWRNYRR